MVTPFALGRILNHDEKSRAFPAATAPTIRSLVWLVRGKRLNQGELGSCTGNALAAWLNSNFAHKPRTPYDDQEDAIDYYSLATTYDPFDGTYPPDDTGSSGLAVCKAGITRGRLTSYRHAFGFDQTLGALQLSPVLIGVNWYEGMFTPSRLGYVEPSGRLAGGHEFLLHGVNVRDRFVWATNSWGTEWGLEGRFKIPFEVLRRLLSEDGDVTVPVV